MEKKWLIGVVILSALIGCCPVSCGNATLEGMVFNNVVVAISSAIEGNSNDVNAMNQIVSQIQTLITNTSNTLYRATGNRLTIGKTIILGPANWYDWIPSLNKQKRDTSAIPFDQPTFDNADIRVDVANTLYGDLPYTQQSRFCKERGDFIHITLNFIKGTYSISQYGTPDQLLAREWVKYFFGVFDEQGYAYNNLYTVKYFAPGGVAILNSCNNTEVDWNDNWCTGQGSVQGLPAYCDLTADHNNGRNAELNTSMMSLPLTPITTQFCSNESGHNSDAPNMQNVMCDGQSIMGVILQHPQLVKGSSPRGDTPPNQPTFVEQKINSTNTLSLGIIWDNMGNDRTTYSAWPSMAKFITYDFPVDTSMAFVQTTTDTTAHNLHFVNITTDKQKTNIVNFLDSPPIKTTSNLRTAFDNITSFAKVQPSSVISAFVVISDSNISPSDWKYMCDTARGINTQLHLISYSAPSVTNFVNANCTGRSTVIQTPKSPYDNTVWDSTVQQCYQYLYERNQFDDFIRALPNVIAPAVYGPPQTFYDEIHFNSTQSSFFVTQPTYTDTTSMTNRFYYESCENLNGNIKVNTFLKCSVNYNVYCSSDGNSVTYCASNIINSTAIENKFSCNVTAVTINGRSQYPPFAVYAVGQPANSIVDPDYPQITLSQWIVVDNQADYTRVRIFARLVRGTTPVFDANVTAAVVTSANTITIQLRDDGSGNPDVLEKDGIYSSYFTQFGTITSYSVTVTATDNNQNAMYPTENYPWISHSNNYGVKVTGSFTRVGAAGSFYVSNWGGVINPGRVMDLRVLSANDQGVTLQWTAPGKDLDYGTVDEYIIKCDTNRDALIGSNFDANNGQDSSIPSVHPATPGTKQTVTINGQVDGYTHYCALKASDGSVYSDASNIISYSILQNGLTSGQIAGISIGVILAVILVVIIAVLVYFKCYRKKNKKVESGNLQMSSIHDDDADKLKPIAVPVSAIHHPGYGLDNEGVQHKGPNSSRISNSTFSDESDKMSKHTNNGPMLTFNQHSRSSSPRPVPLPKVPTPPPHHPIEVIELGSPPSDHVVYTARPHHYERPPDTTVYVINNPDVARPVKLTQLATIEDTGDYQDHNAYKPDIPVYNHLLSKQARAPGTKPPAPPKQHYASHESVSSTSSSDSNNTNRTPKLNSAV